MNLASNPWSFVPGDMTVATIAGANGLVQNADSTVTLTTTVGTTFAVGNYLTVFGTSVSAYNGFYQVLVVTSPTVYILARAGNPLASGLAASINGTVALNQYKDNVRVEDMSWQNASAAGQLLEIRDRNGNLLWSATATAAGSQNRGKLFWVSGLTFTVFGSGVVLATIN